MKTILKMIFMLCILSLFGCIDTIWTSASLIYDRHNIYKKVSNYKLSSMTYKLLFSDKELKNRQCLIEITVFNNDILISGHVPNIKYKKLILQRIKKLYGYRAIYNEVHVAKINSNQLLDSWITAKIRSKILINSNISPRDFKITTTDGIVYIMGDVKPNEARYVIDIAQNTTKVKLIVKLLRYYYLKPHINLR